MKSYQMYIGGEWVNAQSGQVFESVQPWNEEPWALMPRGGAADAEAAVQAAQKALDGPWGALSASARGALMRRLAELVSENVALLAETESRDNGKLLTEMRAQSAYLAEYYYYYAGLADKIEGSVPPIGRPGLFGYTRMEPVGVVAAITPWNSPLLLAASKLAPALAAGCTVVHKPSEFSTASALEFARLVEQAGFPAGVFNVISGLGAEIGAPLVQHPGVARICFTGGAEAGRRIAAAAAQSMTPVDLELGGKSPNIVFADADLEAAANGAVAGIFAASGQSCIAGSRLLVQDSIHDAFVERLVGMAKTAVIGDPFAPDTQIGPVTTSGQFEKVLDYISVAKAEGATCVLGGERLGTRGWFVAPTIFTDVSNNMRIAQEEVFGPVLSVIRFKDADDALRIANETRFGLAAGVWTRDLGVAFRFAEGLKAGTVWVNTYRALSVMLPFGGYKDSGLGRENGQAAMHNFLQPKSVVINHSAPVANPFVMKL